VQCRGANWGHSIPLLDAEWLVAQRTVEAAPTCDEALGWSINSLRRRLLAATAADRLSIAASLVETVRSALTNVYSTDLLPTGPAYDDGTVERLIAIEQEAEHKRRRALEAAGDVAAACAVRPRRSRRCRSTTPQSPKGFERCRPGLGRHSDGLALVH
jgi:hypothetical protein